MTFLIIERKRVLKLTNKKSISFDLDDVLSKFTTSWLDKYNEYYADCLRVEDLKGWEIQRFVKENCGDKIFDILLEPNFFCNVPPKEGAIETMSFLVKHYDIYVVTAYSPQTCLDKYNWLVKHFPMINPKNLIFCNPKHVINTDYLVDDRPLNIDSFKQTGVIFDMPYNEDYNNTNENKKVYRVNDWNDVAVFFSKQLIIEREGK